MRSSIALRRCVLMSAASAFGLALAAPAVAQEYVDVSNGPDATLNIVPNNDVPQGPPMINPANGLPIANSGWATSPDVLSTGVNGIGQMISFNQVSATSASLGLCTGTLINPRTVITASHCVYTQAADKYGSNTGTGGGTSGGFGTTAGIPLSFGFNSTNRCTGVSAANPGNGCLAGTGAYEQWRASGFNTVTAMNIYNANQVWYRRTAQPVNLGGGGEFANGDIALVTLDTHAKDIPTWTLLFSPLDGPTHSTITGYGGTGSGAFGTLASAVNIDYRRRAAENMIDALLSSNNFWPHVDGTNDPGMDHPIYWNDFDDPHRAATGADLNLQCYFIFVNCTDFGALGGHGPDGSALPNEGSTAGGDSGGPLIVDQRWDRQVVAGVLTGTYSYTGGRSFYGQMNVYPPLFEFWEEIVQNNPYVYASAKAGNGDWFDPAHWVQDMDPNYVVIGADGELVNAMPDTHQGGSDGAVAQFGTVCALTLDGSFSDADLQAAYGHCEDASTGTTPTGDGTPLVIAGGPGSTNFVANNVEPTNSATPGATVKARYYDVTLRQAGTTSLSQAATIDKLTIDGAAKLDIKTAGNLKVWAEYNQLSGWTNIDGKLKTDEAMIMTGLLTGKGTFDPTFLTVVGGIVAPGGGDKIGTLTVQGDMIMASASSLFIDAQRGSADKLAVTGDAQNTGMLNVGGAVVFNKVTGGAAPRQNEAYVIASAAGGVSGTFSRAYTFQGVLRPELTYGPNSITATLRAGSLVEILDGGSPVEIAFASALDALRSSSYANLWNLYGEVDWMNGSQLSAMFTSLTPRIIGDVGDLQDRQSKLLTSSVSDRLSLLASGRAEGLMMAGNLTAAFQARNEGVQSGSLGFGASNGGTGVTISKLPGRMTGFISGGVDRTRSSYGGEMLYGSQGGWHMAMGLEMPLGDKGAFGTAVGIADGESTPGGDSDRSRTTMAAAYAAMPLGDGFYVGGLVSAESSRASMERNSSDGISILRLTGATNARRYSAMAEAGYTTGIGGGLTLTPRAQLGYSHYTLDGFTEDGGETALKLDDVSVSRMEARLGAKLEGKTMLAGVAVIPQLSLDYVSLLSGRKTGATVHFAVAPDEAMFLPLANNAAGWAEIKGGVTFGDGPMTLGLSGQHATAGAMADQRAQAELRFRF